MPPVTARGRGRRSSARQHHDSAEDHHNEESVIDLDTSEHNDQNSQTLRVGFAMNGSSEDEEETADDRAFINDRQEDGDSHAAHAAHDAEMQAARNIQASA